MALLASDRASVLAELRARLDLSRTDFVGGYTPLSERRISGGRLSGGLPGIDAWFGGWPSPGVTEIVGAPGSGRLAAILPALATLTRQGRPIVVIDPGMQIHPPGLGLDLTQVVLVRPPGDQAGWVAEQVARSGAVAAMLLLDPPRLGRAGLRISRACEAGNMAVFVVAEVAEADVPAALRLSTLGWQGEGIRIRCTRSRDGRQVGERILALNAGEELNVDAEVVAPEPVGSALASSVDVRPRGQVISLFGRAVGAVQ